MTRHGIIPALIAGMLAAFPAQLVADTWYERYAAAEEALAAGEWRLAIEEATNALEQRGDPGVRVRTYGMKFISYFPYLTLGIAYYELGQLDAALQAFETEEQIGAIVRSDEHLATLRAYRDLALRGQQENAAAEAARIERIVEDGIAEARRLENDGRVDEAVTAIGTALSLSPDNQEALDLLSRLRAEAARRQDEVDLRERAATLVDQGRAYLETGKLTEASSVLSQALSLGENPEARRLFDLAQERLRTMLESDREARRNETIALELAEATALETAGDLARALDRLQAVLAIDPSNAAARALERRLLAAQVEADRTRQRAQTVQGLLLDADSALARGDARAALGFANRILAIEPENREALEHLASAYRLLSKELLGQDPQQNVPPAVSFVDSRQEVEDGSLVELVRRPDFLLSGVVIDDSPVELAFYDETGVLVEGSWRGRVLGNLHLTEFQVARTLATGSSTLRVVASDSEGLTSSSEYAIIYNRPLVRSPWFLALLVLTPFLVLGIVIGLRSRRRRGLRTRRFNPYVAGAPVLDERLFFGRERLLDRILQTLHNNSLLLHGERRIGKTTLQHQLKRRLQALDDPAFAFYPVFIDLQGTRQERFFATLAADVFEELEPDLEGLEPSAPLSESYTYRHLVSDLRRILKLLGGKTAKQVRIVLLIDEVDELNSYDPRINQKLRSLFMKSFAENLVAVVSGVSIKREWDREGSPWYNFFEEIDVGPFRPEDARRLVTEPVQGIVTIDNDAVDRILELADYRPYRIQKLCMRLVNDIYERRRHHITAADVENERSLSESVVS